MSICALHGYNVEDCPICEINRLRAEVERLTRQQDTAERIADHQMGLVLDKDVTIAALREGLQKIEEILTAALFDELDSALAAWRERRTVNGPAMAAN